MRSEFPEEATISTNRHQNQFVEDIGQSVANALFGYNNTNETQTSNNEEETTTIRPKRSAKKVQQVSAKFKCKFNGKNLWIFIRKCSFLSTPLILHLASSTL